MEHYIMQNSIMKCLILAYMYQTIYDIYNV